MWYAARRVDRRASRPFGFKSTMPRVPSSQSSTTFLRCISLCCLTETISHANDCPRCGKRRTASGPPGTTRHDGTETRHAFRRQWTSGVFDCMAPDRWPRSTRMQCSFFVLAPSWLLRAPPPSHRHRMSSPRPCAHRTPIYITPIPAASRLP